MPQINTQYTAAEVTSKNAANSKQSAQSAPNKMGKDEFLQVLLAQLQYQDPMEPMDNSAFVAQMAQFSSLEQLMDLNKELALMRQSPSIASGLIGKSVSWIEYNSDTEKNELVSGVVDSISIIDGIQYAAVGDMAIPIDNIVEIANQPPADQDDGSDAGSGDGSGEDGDGDTGEGVEG
ncbi:flagellar hook capping FlgD N-terminal domain-containing protein [Longirhabdus pacifica]|uniref:flagellar hook capping FlgD N-terminal domain-containing protein n=1 Tax=Longirhabdus pacifica TaxID=2305227 RepID=UPI0013E8E4D9|nr:flagellar hook capping FlgD N-terminal domain-containing protein [Longirhabdus pacifica]